MSEPQLSRRARTLAEAALVRRVAAYGTTPEFVLLGGLVPDLLCTGAAHQHVGTTDVDIQVDLEIEGGSGNAMRLERALQKGGFASELYGGAAGACFPARPRPPRRHHHRPRPRYSRPPLGCLILHLSLHFIPLSPTTFAPHMQILRSNQIVEDQEPLRRDVRRSRPVFPGEGVTFLSFERAPSDALLNDRPLVLQPREGHEVQPQEPLSGRRAVQTATTSTSPRRLWKSSGLRV